MKENDILVFYHIIRNIKEEISTGKIQYSKKKECYESKINYSELNRLQEWILQHKKTKNIFEKLNQTCKELRIKLISVGQTEFIHVYIKGKLLLETIL